MTSSKSNLFDPNILYVEFFLQISGSQWMRPFKIAELVVHKKYNRKGQDSKVAEF